MRRMLPCRRHGVRRCRRSGFLISTILRRICTSTVSESPCRCLRGTTATTSQPHVARAFAAEQTLADSRLLADAQFYAAYDKAQRLHGELEKGRKLSKPTNIPSISTKLSKQDVSTSSRISPSRRTICRAVSTTFRSVRHTPAPKPSLRNTLILRQAQYEAPVRRRRAGTLSGGYTVEYATAGWSFAGGVVGVGECWRVSAAARHKSHDGEEVDFFASSGNAAYDDERNDGDYETPYLPTTCRWC